MSASRGTELLLRASGQHHGNTAQRNLSTSLYAILFSQSPVGFWSWETAHSFLISLYGQPDAQNLQHQLEQILVELSIGEDKSLVTAAILVLLELHFADNRSTWDLISKSK